MEVKTMSKKRKYYNPEEKIWLCQERCVNGDLVCSKRAPIVKANGQFVKDQGPISQGGRSFLVMSIVAR
jgi:hypothetical protein